MRTRLTAITLILGLGFLLRAFFAGNFFGNYDTESFYIVAKIVRDGGNVYAETIRYNYSPVWFHILDVVDVLASALALPMHVLLRLLLSLVDVLNALLIGLIAYSLRPGTALMCLTVYALNPGAIILTGLHGQFETLAMLPILVATLLHLRGRARWLTPLVAVAILIKHNTVFVAWPLLVFAYGPLRAVRALVIAGIFFLVSFIPYVDGGSAGIWQNVFMYRSAPGFYGLSTIATPTLVTVVMVFTVGLLPLFVRYVSVGHAMTMGALAWLVTTPGLSIQYMTILLISGALLHQYRWLLYLLGMGTAIWEVYITTLQANSIYEAAFYAVWPAILWVMLLLWLVGMLLITWHVAPPRHAVHKPT